MTASILQSLIHRSAGTEVPVEQDHNAHDREADADFNQEDTERAPFDRSHRDQLVECTVIEKQSAENGTKGADSDKNRRAEVVENRIDPDGHVLLGSLYVKSQSEHDECSTEDDATLETAPRAVVTVNDNVESEQLGKGNHQPHCGFDNQVLTGSMFVDVSHSSSSLFLRRTLSTAMPAQ